MKRLAPPVLSLSTCVMLSLGCAPENDVSEIPVDSEGATSGSDSGEAGTGGPSGTGSSASGGSEGTGGAETSGGGETAGETGDGPPPEDLPPPPATGIEIVHVVADQGTKQDVARDGALVPGSERTVPLLKGRNTVLRAFYEVDPGYESRDIYAVLHIEQSDGTTTEYENFIKASDKSCEGEDLVDCRYATLPNSFFWRVPGKDVQPDMRYWIELLETKPGHENDVSDKVPVFPTDGGSLLIGIEDSYQKMRVVLVPVYHAIGGSCPEAPDLNEEYGTDLEGNPRTVADFFAERLLAQNPADEVEIVVHETMNFTGSMEGAQLLGWLQNLRFQENAPPEYFYYAVGRPCDDGPSFAGVAQIGGPTKGEASYRVGWGVYYSNVGTTADTFVHEIGHQQGRAHIHCSGEEAGTDPSYPDNDGDLVSWGIDTYSSQLKVHDPGDHDYMTYCQSTWVSQWGYLKVLPWIAEMSSWDFEGGSQDAGKQPLLVGNIAADGTEQWYVTEGWLPNNHIAPSNTIAYAAGATVIDEQAAAVVQWERSEDLNIIAPLPDDFESVTEIAVRTPDLELSVPRSAITELATTDFVAK